MHRSVQYFAWKVPIITHGNKILHMTRHGISRGIYTRVHMTQVIYTARLLAVKASYTIHENDY